MTRTERDRVWAMSPGGRPGPEVVIGAERAGAFGVLDLGRDDDAARAALAATASRATASFGVRVAASSTLTVADLPDLVTTVIVAATDVAEWLGAGRRVVVELSDPDRVPADGADGLVVEDLAALTRLLAGPAAPTVPVWVRGVPGVHVAAGAIAAGAEGVLLDDQLALIREARLPESVRRAVAAADRGGDVPAGFAASVVVAAAFARRWRTVGRAVTAIRRAVDDHVAAAVQARPLDPAGQGRSPLVVVSDAGHAIAAPTTAAQATGLAREGVDRIVLADGDTPAGVLEAERQIDALATLGRLDGVELLLTGVHDEPSAALAATAVAPLAAAGARIGIVAGDRADWGIETAPGAAADEVLAAVSALHDEVTRGATACIEAAADRMGLAASASEARPVDVAIVGMGAVLPGAPDVETFWANIVDGVDSVTEVSPDRWDPAVHFDPTFDPATIGKVPNPKTVSKWGGWVPDVEFDALAWGIPPASLAAIDPVQILALKAAADALADAGYADGGFDRDRASVIYASGSGGGTDLASGFGLRSFLPSHFDGVLPPELDEFLPRLTEDGFPGILTSVIAGRVANRLDLGGKNLTVDAACASTVAALDIACNELVAGTSDLVLCGGADLHNALHDFFYFTAVQALSKRGRCASFDADADGMTLGEGVGCLVLKRLADAERDGDRIYAVIKGVAGSSDGRHLGLTAPRQQGQEKALRRAYAAAGISPAAVTLVEAHGTGTVAGDRTELGTLTEVYTEAGARPGSVVLGSVKSNIGHIKCAAGIASLIKAAKAIHHGVLPATLHVNRPNDAWDADTSPFTFIGEARPWADERRVAAISSFGFGGTNFHAVLEGHGDPLPETGRERWPVELFAFRGEHDADVDAALDALIARLDAECNRPVVVERFRLRDIAAAVAAEGAGPVRVALVAGSVAELASAARAAKARAELPGVHRLDAVGTAVGDHTPGVAVIGAPGPTAVTDAMAQLLVAFPGARPLAAADRGQAVAAVLRLVGVEARTEPAGDDLAERLESLHAAGCRVFVDAGGAEAVTTAANALGPGDHLVVRLERPGTHGLTALVDTLARLAVAGVPLDLDALFAHRGADPERWTAAPKPAGWVVNGQFVRAAATGEPLAGGLRPSTEAPRIERGELVPMAPPAPAPAPAGPIGTPPPATAGDLVLLEYLRTTNGLILTAADILRNALGIDLPIPQLPAVAPATPPTAPAPVPNAPPVTATVTPLRPAATAAPVPAPVDRTGITGNGTTSNGAADDGGTAAAAALLADPDALLERLVDLVSARTGYPPDMLDPDLDVEADLSIDSIKRIEILGELADGIGLGEGGAMDHLESLVEELAARKTLRSIVAWLVERGDLLTGSSSAAATPAAANQ